MTTDDNPAAATTLTALQRLNLSLTRYSMHATVSAEGAPDPDGEWVKYADVVAAEPAPAREGCTCFPWNGVHAVTCTTIIELRAANAALAAEAVSLRELLQEHDVMCAQLEAALAATSPPPAEARDLTLPEVRQLLGFLSGALPELHDVEVPRLADVLDRFLDKLPGRAPGRPEGPKS